MGLGIRNGICKVAHVEFENSSQHPRLTYENSLSVHFIKENGQRASLCRGIVKTAPQMNNVCFAENDTSLKSKEQQLPKPICLNGREQEKRHIKRIKLMLTFRKLH